MNQQEISREIQNWIEHNRSRIVDLLSSLVSHNTVNLVTSGNEEDCQKLIYKKLVEMGLDAQIYNPEEIKGFHEHPAYYPGKDYSARPNVDACWKGKGQSKSLLFSSHIDTAVVAPGWETDPFSLTKNGSHYIGLGSYDMKGGLVASMMAVACLKELGIELLGDVWIESVVDEEFGGANGTVAGRAKGLHADAVIIPEPTNLAIYPATRGGALWRLTFQGTTGLSFNGEVIVNPINEASRFIVFLESYEKARSKVNGPAPWYDEDSSTLPIIATRLEAGDMKAPLCDVGPVECYLDIWIECYPGVSESELQEDLLRAYSSYCNKNEIIAPVIPTFDKMIRFLPGSEVDPQFPLIALLEDKVKKVTRNDAVVTGSPFACDAFVFNLFSPSKAIILGPTGGNAHAPGEFIDLDSLEQLIEIYAETIMSWCEVSSYMQK